MIASASFKASRCLSWYSARVRWASSRRRCASSSSALMRSARSSSALPMLGPILMPPPTTTMTKATRTQNSGSWKSSIICVPSLGALLEHGVDRGAGARILDFGADKLRRGGARDLDGDAAQIGHRRRFCGGDALLGDDGALGDDRACLAQTLGGDGAEPLAGLLHRQLRLVARVGERLLIGGDDRLGLGLHLASLVEIAFDAIAALVDDLLDPRQRQPRHQQIEDDEEDGEPEDLRREG